MHSFVVAFLKLSQEAEAYDKKQSKANLCFFHAEKRLILTPQTTHPGCIKHPGRVPGI